MEVYVTMLGDTWDSIAYKTTGNAMLMDLFIAENPELCEMFVFPAGIEVKIPDIPEESASALPPWFQ